MAVTVENGYIKMTALNDQYTGRLEPVFYRWVGATAGHSCVVKEHGGSGSELYSAVANGIDVAPSQSPKSRYIHNPKVTTLGSGVLEIHCKSIG